MALKDRLLTTIRAVIAKYDFEDAIESALDRINIDDLVEEEISTKISKLDLQPLIEDYVKDYIDEELDEIDLEAEMLRTLDNVL